MRQKACGRICRLLRGAMASALNPEERGARLHQPSAPAPKYQNGPVYKTRVPRRRLEPLKITSITASFLPYRTVSCLMAIISGQARPEITHINVHNKWLKMQSNNSPRVAKLKAIVFHPLPHFHHHSFPFIRIARSAHNLSHKVPKGTRHMGLSVS